MKLKSRFLPLGAALVAAAAVGACTDPTRLEARYETLQDTLVAFAMTRTPAAYPSALLTAAQQDADPSGEPVVVRIGGALPFDVAFDIDATDNAVIYPLGLVVSDFGGQRRVGLQRAATPFDGVLRAPANGYVYDSAMVARPGEAVLIEAQQAPYCAQDLLRTIYAKLVVDSVNSVTRTVHFRVGLDPNCGFRSFAPGVPND
jgi:hypothetical protein